MKVRQTYLCKNDVICIQFLYDSQGRVIELKEIDPKSPMESGEYIIPKVEVTDMCFSKIINNPRLT